MTFVCAKYKATNIKRYKDYRFHVVCGVIWINYALSFKLFLVKIYAN